jgi:Rps23 Pro-64 3,4-dihydroxylase Tpa1-like proline 4-hydroxylase
MAAIVQSRLDPFPHAVSASFLEPALAEQALAWLETAAPWKLHIEDFYEQHECSLTADMLPADLVRLVSGDSIKDYARALLDPIGAEDVEFREATAHRLTGGQSIRIHNDFIEGAETHRILIQLNRNWADEDGGFLMLFSSADAGDVARVIRPLHRSAVAFEISPNSFHAVSPTVAGERYTLVFSYRRCG